MSERGRMAEAQHRYEREPGRVDRPLGKSASTWRIYYNGPDYDAECEIGDFPGWEKTRCDTPPSYVVENQDNAQNDHLLVCGTHKDALKQQGDAW